MKLFFFMSFEETLRRAPKQRGRYLVAEREGRIVGGVSLTTTSCGKKKIGIVEAIVTDKNLRGRGIGKSLLDEATSWLEGRGCEIICAVVDRCNSPSWNMFIHKGFSTYRLREQLKDFGLKFISLWLSTYHLFAVGLFLRRKIREEGESKEAGEAWHLLAAWLMLILIWCVLIVRAGKPLVLLLAISGVMGLSFLAHELAHKLAASRFKLETTFRAWGSGLAVSLMVAFFGKFFLPCHGSTYVKQVDWRYDFKSKGMGLIYTAGPTMSLALAALFLALSMLSVGDLSVVRAGHVMNISFAIVNLIPLRSFAWDGWKVFAWNKIAWALLAAGAVMLMLIG